MAPEPKPAGFDYSSLISPLITGAAGGIGAALQGRAVSNQIKESGRQFDIANALAQRQQLQQELTERQKFEVLLNGLVNQGLQNKAQAEQGALAVIPGQRVQQAANLAGNINQNAASSQNAYQALIAALMAPAMRR